MAGTIIDFLMSMKRILGIIIFISFFLHNVSSQESISIVVQARITDNDTLITQTLPEFCVNARMPWKLKAEFTYGGESDSEEEDVEWGSDEENDDLKRLDFGLTMGAGVEISSIQIGLTYGLGLANISSYNDNGNKINNRVLGISVGYKFGGKQ